MLTDLARDTANLLVWRSGVNILAYRMMKKCPYKQRNIKTNDGLCSLEPLLGVDGGVFRGGAGGVILFLTLSGRH